MFNVGGERIRDSKQLFRFSVSPATSAHIPPTRRYLDVELLLSGLLPSILNMQFAGRPLLVLLQCAMLRPLSIQSIMARAAGRQTRKTNSLETVVPSQCMQLYPGNEDAMSALQSSMVFLLPILQSLARALSGAHALLPPQGLPNGSLARNKYPMLVEFWYIFNIRMDDLRVDQLSVRPRRPRWHHDEKSRTNASPTLRGTGP
jgi:hypothetical protein